MDTLNDISAWSNNFDELQSPLKRTDFWDEQSWILVVVMVAILILQRSMVQVIAIDHSEDAVRMTKANTRKFQHVHVIQADAGNLPIKEASMDRVYSFGVLHHTDNPYEIMDEAHRVLISGGPSTFGYMDRDKA